MSDIVAKRWETYALTYDTEAPRGVPCYRHLHAEILRRLPFPKNAPVTVVDLGSGGGRLLESVLTRFPNARAVWVDPSPVMRVIAGRRLARFNGRVHYVEGAMERCAWENALPAGCDAVVSAIAIHHLTDPQKQALFGRIHRALRPGGIVAIADEVLGGDWATQAEHLRAWDQHTRRQGAAHRVSPNWLALWQHFCERVLPDPEHNPTEHWTPAATQVQWLRDAGFADAQVWWEYRLWAVFGGTRNPDPETAAP